MKCNEMLYEGLWYNCQLRYRGKCKHLRPCQGEELQEIYPLSELKDEGVSVTVVIGGCSMLYYCWIEMVVNLQGNYDPDLSMTVPFLVSQLETIRWF